MNVRWIAIGFFVVGGFLGCGGSDSGKANPCTTVCNCVVKELGADARSQCASECTDVAAADDPVQDCKSRLAARGVTTCNATCAAFTPDESDGTGGKSGTGGASGNGGSTGTGGGDTGGTSGSGGASPSGGSGGKILGNGGTSVGNGGAIGTGGSGGVASGGSPIGRRCTRDADCGKAGVTCLTTSATTFEGGGPAGGICVADCTGDPTKCAPIDPNATCVSLGTSAADPAYCMESCTVGPSNASKCHNRAEMACDDTGGSVAGDGFCRPVCANDDDCGTRKCNLGTGVCIDGAPAGTLPIGSPCSPSAATDPCAGVCVPLTSDPNGPGMCGGLCTLGAPVGCGAPSDGSPYPSICLFPLTTAEPDVGDLGLCGQLCNCDDECKASGRACRPLSADEAKAVGYLGYCGGATDPDTGAATEHLACK